MRILWVGTKPPWPPLDGGRLVAARTLEALAAAGHAVTVVVPSLGSAAPVTPEPSLSQRAVPAGPRKWPGAMLRSILEGTPTSIARHSLRAVRREVEALVGGERFDVVHAEQVQALPQCEAAFRASLPVVLRAQNVESELWAGMGSWFAGWEARRMAAWEGEAVRRVSAAVAFTAQDAARLRRLSGREHGVSSVRPPWPSRLPPAASPLAGSPAVVLFGNPAWRPNREGAAWFVRETWPLVRNVLPDARLHAFGLGAAAGSGIVPHPAPADSRAAFPEGGILVVPLRSGSGIRVKILEAWARGVPVVSTPTGAEGLDAESGEQLLLAESPQDFAAAIRRLHEDPALGRALAAAGQRRLEAEYEPAKVTDALVAVYRSVIGPQA